MHPIKTPLAFADSVSSIEILAHLDPTHWPKSADPALLHPFSSRCIQILDTYKRMYRETGKEQPFIKQAGYVNTFLN